MAFQISDQLRSFGLAILLGLAAGVVYDLLRTVRLRFPSFTGVLDLLYCLTAGGALSLFVLRQADGQFRGFILLGPPGAAWCFSCCFPLFCVPSGIFGWIGAWNFYTCWSGLCGKAGQPAKKSSSRRKTSFIFVKNTLQ